MRFPKQLKHRGRTLARIYGKSETYPMYRVAWNIGGRRLMKAFPNYSEAKRHGDKLVKDLASGSQATALTAGQASDALAALERLESFYQQTGRRVSLLASVSEYSENAAKLGGRTMGEAVDGYLTTVASVKRMDLKEAVEEFLKAEEPRAKSNGGQRAQLSAKYAYNRAIMLRRFAGKFPGTALCDLAKELVDKFVEGLSDFSAKSRNHHRATVRQFLEWAVRKDYLPATNRLGEAEGMRPERANTADVLVYTPKEFATILGMADETLRPIIAIGGLAGLRSAELLRLTWEDVWRVPGHIEVTAGKAKTRARRLVEMCPSLAGWLEPFRARTEGKLWNEHEISFQRRFSELCAGAKVPRKANGLRHGFCTYHFAAYANENVTAQQAGNSPAMVHAHYKGLATKAEAEKWFGVIPTPNAPEE